MSRLHNRPNAEVMHISVHSGAFNGTVTKSFSGYAGEYSLAVAVDTASVSKASTVAVKPYVDEAQTAVGTAIKFHITSATTLVTAVPVGTASTSDVWVADSHFAPFGYQVVFSTTSATGTGTIDFFARLRG